MRAPIEKIRGRGVMGFAGGIAIPNDGEGGWVVIAKRMQNQGVDHAEHGGVGADAEGQGDDDGESDPGRSPENTQGKSEILREGFHEFQEKAVSTSYRARPG